MTAALKGDAAIRWTEGGQSYIHHLAAKLRDTAEQPWQRVHQQASDDGTGLRRISVGAELRELEATLPFDGSPEVLSSMLAAGMRGAEMEYFPSLTNPSEVYPFILMGHGRVRPDPQLWFRNRYEVDIRARRLDAGTFQGVVQEPLFYYRAGNPLPGLIFTRPGAVGSYVDEEGVIQSSAADLFRTTWIDGDPILLLEAARTNLVDSDTISAWTDGNTTTVTGSIDDPAGGTGAYRITGDGGSAFESRSRVVSFTGDGVKTAVFEIRESSMPASGNQAIGVYDVTGTTSRLELAITGWSDGEPTITETAGTLLGKRYIGNGYWRIYGQTTSVTASNTHRVYVWSNLSASAGAIDVHRANAFDAIDPSASILDASAARNDDTFYATWPHAPRSMTLYVKFREFTELSGGNWPAPTGIVYIGNSGDSGSRIRIYRPTGSGDVYAAQFINGSSAVGVAVDVAPSYLDEIELCLTVTSTGVLTLHGSNGGATTVSSSASAANGMPTAWGDTRIYLNSFGASRRGLAAFRSVKVAPDLRDLAYMRAY